MIRLDDYKGADGRIDWTAYNRAQVDAGEKCRKCGSFIVFSSGHPTTCSDCDRLVREAGEVSHDHDVRCPKCRHVMSVHDSELWDLYEEGEHEISCRSCDHEFSVTTRVSYSFESPELLEEEESSESEGANGD